MIDIADGGVVALLVVCGSAHHQGYLDVAMVGIVGPALALAAVIVLGSALSSFESKTRREAPPR